MSSAMPAYDPPFKITKNLYFLYGSRKIKLNSCQQF